MTIRKANFDDLETIMGMIDASRNVMRKYGNPNQWPEGTPSREKIQNDIEKGQSLIIECEGRPEGTFCFQKGIEPTYKYIEDGKWPDTDEYCTIHRLASFGNVKGIGQACITWSLEHADVVRADTHKDNFKIQQLLQQNGFQYCGIVYMDDGTQRLAYQHNR